MARWKRKGREKDEKVNVNETKRKKEGKRRVRIEKWKI